MDETSDEFMSMSRFWFVSEDEVSSIQVQKSAFLLNWRRRSFKYPHFAANLKPGFDKYLGIFMEFLRNDVGVEAPAISHYELAYVNVIELSDYWQGLKIRLELSDHSRFRCTGQKTIRCPPLIVPISSRSTPICSSMLQSEPPRQQIRPVRRI